ncbi:MAG: hypothetical protein L0H78_02960 [Humibacillus sp.]|nr:hypothetical protein [Humibacillus sp.]
MGYICVMKVRQSWLRDADSVRTWDGVVAFWVVFWLVVGALAGWQIWNLGALSTGVVDSGRALGTAGKALQDISGLPVIGERTGELGQQVVTSGASIVAGGQEAATSTRVLAILLGFTIGFGPLGPVLFVYLPGRLAWRAEVAQIGSLLGDPTRRDAVMAALARRCLTNLTVAEVLKVTRDPEADLAAGRHDRLAAAELRRLGLRLTDLPGS